MESGRINLESGRNYINTEIAVDTDRKPESNDTNNEEFRRKI